jgi:sugar phosphate isomerase/epimerase
MKISTSIGGAYNLVGLHKAVEYTAKAGFDAWDLPISSMYNGVGTPREIEGYNGQFLKLVKELKQIGLDNGIYCNQTHAPDPTFVDKSEDVMKKSIEITAELGASICVVHPGTRIPAERNVEFFSKLMPFAREYGVKLAVENMWDWDTKTSRAFFCNCSTPESYLEHILPVNDDHFVACLDIGHAEMMGDLVNSVDIIKGLGNKIQALHIHDNDKRNDSHEIPLSMDIDFPSIVKALKEIGYSGDFTLEASTYLTHFTADNVLQALTDMAVADRKLAAMFEEA